MAREYEPSLSEFRRLAAKGCTVPVSTEILADLETPVSAFLKLDDTGFSFLLESVEGGEKLGRYSFLGVSPAKRMASKDDRVVVWEGDEVRHVTLKGKQSPLDILKAELGKVSFVQRDGLPRFVGGAVGYVGYDVVRFLEKLPDSCVDDLQLADCQFMFADALVIFDHVKHRIRVLTNALCGDNPDRSYREATDKIDEMVDKLRKPAVLTGPKVKPASEVQVKSNVSREDYLALVERAKEYIAAGDIIQVVPSQRFECQVHSDPLDIYRALRSLNPSPYMYYLSFDDLKIIGSSPEILVTEDHGKVTTRPIAGTAPRGATPMEDEELARRLLADEKERAEHVMLVDLGRNDLGRVCQPGTVKVDEFMAVEKYSHVMHIVSNVTGILGEDKDQFDVLAACFPAGTVAGAPKIRAMEIIDELEPTRRGPYAGAIGYFSYSGNMDTCIAIRTLVLKGNRAYVQAGGGVVADSAPEREYQESVNKARAVIRAIEIAEAGLE